MKNNTAGDAFSIEYGDDLRDTLREVCLMLKQCKIITFLLAPFQYEVVGP